MPASIVLDQATIPAGVAGTSRNDLVIGQPVTCSNTTVETSYTWTLTDVPIRSALVRGTVGAAATFSFTPDVKGTYRVTLQVNSSALVSDNTVIFGAVLSVGARTLGWRYFSAEERREDNIARAGLGFPANVNTRGWATDSDLQFEAIETSVWETLNAVSTSPGLVSRLVKVDATTGQINVSLIPGAAPSGPAGGDLSGTFPNPNVARIAGRTVDTAVPAIGDILKWDGLKWAVTVASGFADGLVTAPGIQFISDTNTGIYRPGADILAITTGSTERARFAATDSILTTNWLPSVDNTQNLGSPAMRWANAYVTNIVATSLQFPDGSVSAPSIAFILDPNTGFYRIASNTIGVATNGVELSRFTDTQYLTIAGTALLPSIGFTADSTTGLYRVSAFVLGIATGGVNSARFGINGIQVADGLVSTPAFSFIGDVNTGFYRITADQLGVTTGGALTATFKSLGGATPQLELANGVVGSPSLTFAAGNDTGLYSVTAQSLGVAAFGIQVVRFGESGAPQAIFHDGTSVLPSMAFASDTGAGFSYTPPGVYGSIVVSIGGDVFWEFRESAFTAVAGNSSIRGSALAAATPVMTFGQVNDGPLTASTAIVQRGALFTYVLNQTSTAGFSAIQVDVTNTALGSGVQYLADFKVGGTTIAAITNGSTAALRGRVLVGPGALTTPALAFIGDVDTGLYSIGADILGIIAGGVEAARFRSVASADPQLIVAQGMAAKPSISFNDTFFTAGLFQPAAGTIGFASGATERWRLNSGSLTAISVDAAFVSGVVNQPLSYKGNITAGADAAHVFSNDTAGAATPFTGAATAQKHVQISAAVNQTLTAGFTALDIAITETAVGTGAQYLINAKSGLSGTTQRFYVSNGSAISSSGTDIHVRIQGGVNQTGTAAFTLLDLAAQESATGSGAQYFINAKGGLSGITQRFAVSNTGRVQANQGTQFAASYSYVGDTATGWFSPGAGQISFTSGGILCWSFTGFGFLADNVNCQMQNSVNTALSAPSYSFNGDSNTGLGWVSANIARLIADGVEVARFQTVAAVPKLVTTTVEPIADNTYPLGAAAMRWSNVYTVVSTVGDLVMRDPKAAADDRDAAHWRIIEGKDGIYAYNIRLGVKYRLAMDLESMDETDREIINADRSAWRS